LGFPKLTNCYRKQTELLTILNNFADELIQTQKEKRNENDWKLIYEFFDAKVNETFLSDEKLRREINFTVFGANGTLQTVMAFVLYNLAKYPEEQQKVFREANEILESNRDRNIEETDLNQMHYTEAFIKETMRIYTPAPCIARKIKSEVTAGGFTFPKDAEIVIAPYLMGRSKTFFEKPLKFDTNRFLQKDSDPEGFVQFSLAPKKCLGRKIAFAFMKIFILRVVSNFEISLPDDHEELILFMNPTLTSKTGIVLDFNERIK
jgi:cytochrome P450 family 4